MKILFSSYHNPHFETITEYSERAIQALGHDLVSFDDRAFVLPGRVRCAMPFLASWDLDRLNRMFVAAVKKTLPDLCIVTGGHRILPWAVDAAKKAGAKVVLWTIDPPLDFDPVSRHAVAYTKVFCGGSEALELLAAHGIASEFLPFAYDGSLQPATIEDASEHARYGSDVCFVGSHYPNRERFFEKLSDVDLGIWGPSWGKLAPTSPLRGKIRCVDGVQPEVWKKVLTASKMTVVAHYHDGDLPCHQVSPKVYEAMACGCMVLCDRQKDAQTLFAEDETIVFYDDADDARAKIAQYLSHDADRRRIADAARRLVAEKHTYVRRMEQLLRSVYGT
jgi:spore maturation protein CgeB